MITLKLQSSTTEVDPGGTPTWSFMIENRGNGADKITLSLAGVPESWNAELDSSKFELASRFPGQTSKVVTLLMEVPSNESSGQYSFEIMASSLGTSSSVVFNLTINAIYQVGVSEVGEVEKVGQPGKEVYFTFDSTNLGNSNDAFELSASGTMISPKTVIRIL